MNTVEKMDTVYTPAHFHAKTEVEFHIPIYQRLFTWDENQINTLLDDLHSAWKNAPQENYYIGIMTAVNKHEDNAEGETWEIVDGQQRLTFLSLLATQLKSGDVKHPFLFMTNNALRIRYIGREDDMKSMKKLAGILKDDIAVNANMMRFVDCFEAFKVKHSITDASDFSKFVYERTTFLISWLNHRYSPHKLNEYFERLNATGRQLEPEEIVKGCFFSEYAAQWNQLIDFSKKYKADDNDENSIDSNFKTLWDILKDDIGPKELQEPAPDSKPKNAVRSILSVPVFLLHVLRLTCGDDVSLNPRNLVGTFKQRLDGKSKDFMDNMCTYRTWLDDNIVHYTEDGLEFWKDEQTELNDGTPASEDEKTAVKKLSQFQSMLTVSSGETQQWVLEAYENGVGLEELKTQDCGRHEFNEDMSLSYPGIERYWFWKLDYLLWERFIDTPNDEMFKALTDAEKTAIRNYKFRPNRSIEHLHPQTSTNAWEGNDLHSFGNLAMISSSFNSAQSNDSVGVKFARLCDKQIPEGKLESIKMLLMFRLADGKDVNWKQEIAGDHEKTMRIILKPKPKAKNGEE